MTDQPLEWLMEQPAASLILAAYAEREAQLPKRPSKLALAATNAAATAESPIVPAGEAESAAESDEPANEADNADAWIPRVSAIEGVESGALSQLHGGLIARGLLKYELFGRTIGMRYRLTPEGRRAAEIAPSTLPVAAAEEGPVENEAGDKEAVAA
ncbi:hypothetical protein Pan44_16070 [Caulifigura coniformis]|uniref:Uncharacterized protein n=1 Tax=Caulifigura coniformis TaxID=2527983 RepID=A0A517SBU3_9PLAN|nr:hypothetical protein [Caulifigura coniformis]QDT53585.1 hypothetical protein Pan44_16070 [Caulifigura coniformis]